MSEKEQKTRPIDGREFVSLITANQRRIFAYILTLVPHMNDADDILQETTALMWERKEDFQAGTDFVAWGSRIAYFKILDHRKRQNRDHRMIIQDEQLDQIADKALTESGKTAEMIQKIDECLKKLPASDQNLLHLRYTLGLSAKHISLRICKSIRLIYLNLSRVHGQLLDCVEGR